MASVMRQLFYPTYPTSEARPSSIPPVSRSLSTCCGDQNRFSRRLAESPSSRNLAAVARSSQESDGIVAGNDDEEGISLGTMKLPLDIDLQRFDSLLFQWANSLCQGANLPLPVPLKVDKIQGGARLGFITIGDGKTEVFVYIDCVVSPATAGSGPIFRAIRNGPLKEQSPPGEPRIMRSLLEALKKSVEISRV